MKIRGFGDILGFKQSGIKNFKLADPVQNIDLFNLAEKEITCSDLRKTYPNYFISKNKIDLDPSTDIQYIFDQLKENYLSNRINLVDGMKIDFDNGWVHLRRSNTEPIIRIYSESSSKEKADNIADDFIKQIKEII